jgi:hypothetical protein
MTDRDYVGEMQAHIERVTQGSGWVPAVVAAKLAAELEERDPDLLEGWLRAMAAPLLTSQITLRERARRTVARHRAQARGFREAAERAGAGDLESLSMFNVTFAVDEEDTRVRVPDMTGSHHEFVASGYAVTGNAVLLEAEFHRAVAQKIGSRTTAEVFTEEQYTKMYRSLTGNPPGN